MLFHHFWINQIIFLTLILLINATFFDPIQRWGPSYPKRTLSRTYIDGYQSGFAGDAYSYNNFNTNLGASSSVASSGTLPHGSTVSYWSYTPKIVDSSLTQAKLNPTYVVSPKYHIIPISDGDILEAVVPSQRGSRPIPNGVSYYPVDFSGYDGRYYSSYRPKYVPVVVQNPHTYGTDYSSFNHHGFAGTTGTTFNTPSVGSTLGTPGITGTGIGPTVGTGIGSTTGTGVSSTTGTGVSSTSGGSSTTGASNSVIPLNSGGSSTPGGGGTSASSQQTTSFYNNQQSAVTTGNGGTAATSSSLVSGTSTSSDVITHQPLLNSIQNDELLNRRNFPNADRNSLLGEGIRFPNDPNAYVSPSVLGINPNNRYDPTSDIDVRLDRRPDDLINPQLKEGYGSNSVNTDGLANAFGQVPDIAQSIVGSGNKNENSNRINPNNIQLGGISSGSSSNQGSSTVRGSQTSSTSNGGSKTQTVGVHGDTDYGNMRFINSYGTFSPNSNIFKPSSNLKDSEPNLKDATRRMFSTSLVDKLTTQRANTASVSDKNEKTEETTSVNTPTDVEIIENIENANESLNTAATEHLIGSSTSVSVRAVTQQDSSTIIPRQTESDFSEEIDDINQDTTNSNTYSDNESNNLQQDLTTLESENDKVASTESEENILLVESTSTESNDNNNEGLLDDSESSTLPSGKLISTVATQKPKIVTSKDPDIQIAQASFFNTNKKSNSNIQHITTTISPKNSDSNFINEIKNELLHAQTTEDFEEATTEFLENRLDINIVRSLAG